MARGNHSGLFRQQTVVELATTKRVKLSGELTDLTNIEYEDDKRDKG